MSDSLQELLEKLNGVSKKTFSGREIEASNLVRDIVSTCQDFVTASEIEYGSSLLFNEDFGVLTFIRATANIKEFENAKTDLLGFLAAYSERIGDAIAQYTKAIKDACMLALNIDGSSKVKIESFNLLIKLLCSKNKIIQEKLDVPSLAERFFSLCLQSSKQSSAGVRGAIFNSLGVISQRFPEHLTEKADRLSSIYLGALREQMATLKKPDFQVIAGCLRGLTGYLVSFSKAVEGGSKYATELFGYIRKVIDPKINLARYDLPKAGLALLEKHSFHFRELITNDYRFIYEVLYTWSMHSNKEMWIAGMKALDSCLYQISKCIVEQGKNQNTMSILRVFLKDFHRVLNSDSSSVKDLSLAIKGFGLFAEACKVLLDEKDLNMIFDEILIRSQHLFSNMQEMTDNTMHILPSFLVSFADIMQHVKEVSSVNLVTIERMVVILFESYPRLGRGGMFTYRKGLAHFIRALSNNANVFKVSLSQIVYQGLIRTCSHPVVTEEGLSSGFDSFDADVQVSYQSYTELWLSLLRETSYKDHTTLDDASKTAILRNSVYDEMIQSILLLTKKLKFGTVSLEPEAQKQDEIGGDCSPHSSDVISSVVPNFPKDIQIFINLVEFCREVLLKCDAAPFGRWVSVFVKELIILSSRHPLISGFYKLLQVSAMLCMKLNFFENSEKEDPKPVEKEATISLFSKYVNDILGGIRQFKDDLLLSCLQLLLHLPVEIIEDKIHRFAKPIKMALKLGLSYNELASSTLDALEMWRDKVTHVKMKSLLFEILPYFDGYLQTAADKPASSRYDKEDPIVLGHSSHTRRHRVPIKLLKALRDSSKTIDSPLTQLRYRIAEFLGNLGGSINVGIIKEDGGSERSHAVSWDSATQLSFALPFGDMKPTVYLDAFMPRVIELATTSSDRQTKVVACELLHALTMFVLGKSTQQTSRNTKEEGKRGIYSHLFPAVLKLGCDIEQVAEQLFRPLVFQMIHWFTSSPSKTESLDTVILLDAILAGLVNHNNNALREFSASCLCEFLEWSIKQSPAKKLEKTAVNPKAVFKRVYNMASHPSAYMRLGASAAFNSFYKVFREHDDLVDIYVLEMLVKFVQSLGLAHSDEPVIGTTEHSKRAIDHLQRIIKQKSKLLFKANKYRRVPPVLQSVESTEFTIDHIFTWLLGQCGSPRTECRHKCMELLFNLLPTRPGICHARNWFANTLESDGPEFFVERFECNNGIKLSTQIVKVGSTLRMNDLLSWHGKYLAALDCYMWIFDGQLIKAESLLLLPESGMVACVSFFINELALHEMESTIVKLLRICKKKDAHVLTALDIETYNRSKCTAMVRTFDFLTSTLVSGMWKNDSFDKQRSDIFSNALHQMACHCIFKPHLLGFNIADVEVLKSLPELLCSFIMAMKKGLQISEYQDFIAYLKSNLSTQRYDLSVYMSVNKGQNAFAENQNIIEVQQLVSGYETLNKAGILQDCIKPKDLAFLRSKILSYVLDGFLPLSCGSDVSIIPSQKHLIESMLSLALHLKNEQDAIVEILLDDRPILMPKGEERTSSRATVFYHHFYSTVNDHIIESDGSMISRLLDIKSSNFLHAATIVHEILEFVIKREQACDDKIKSRVDHILAPLLSNWMRLSHLWKSDASIEAKAAALNILRCLITINAKATLESSSSNAPPTFATYLQLLSDSKTGLRFKTRMFEFLPSLLNGLDEDKKEILSKALKRFIADSFPVSSADLNTVTTRHSEYSSCLQQLFKSLANSSCHTLLDALLTVIVNETDDVYERVILPSLKVFSKRLSSTEAEKCLSSGFDVLINEDLYTGSTRQSVTNRIVLTFFHGIDRHYVKTFYVKNIKNIVEKIEARLAKQVESVFEAQIITKICCFKLLQTLFVLFSKDELTSKSSDIVNAYLASPVTGKELTQAVTKAAHGVKSEDCRGETMLADLRRELHCAAYNALCSVIVCTQTEQKFYTGFLFTENKVKGQMLLDNIINTSEDLSFDAEQTVPFARKKQLQMIRRKRETTQEDDEFQNRGYLPYLSSQYLMDSSLSEDVGQFDFSTPIQAFTSPTNSAFLRSKGRFPTEMGRSMNDAEEDASSLPEDVLEMDRVNQNDCMPVLVSLLKHMKDSNVYDHPAKGKEGGELPSWMNCLWKKFNASDTTINVKLFIIKLIINVPKVFEPFGKFWFGPIVKLIVSKEIGGDPMSYFIIDTVVVMLSWSDTCIPEDSVVGKCLSSSLLDYLILHCHHNNRAVLKHNLQVIKTLTKVWKERLEVTYKFVYDKFSIEDIDTKDNMTGIQILGVLLSNGFLPYRSEPDLSEEKYYSALVHNLSFKYKDVFASAAEVIGLAMKRLSENQDSVECPIFVQAYEKLVSMEGRADKFVMCLHRMQLNYSPIVDKFVVQLLYMLPSLHGILRQQCLEALASCIESYEEPRSIFTELKGNALDACLNHRDGGVQLAAINLLNGLLKYLTAQELLPFLQSIAKLSSSSFATLRDKTYEIFMWIYDNYRFDEQTIACETSLEVLKLSKEILLLGINDTDTDISLKVLNFWRHETRLPNSTIERFIEILRALYSTKTEKEFLSYSTNLLLQLTSLSTDYSLPLFNEPLDSSKRFEEYNVNFSWQRQRLAMTPLFAATQNQSQMSSQGGSLSTGMLRATQQSFQFMPTQQEAGTPENWMNPSFQISSNETLPSQIPSSQTSFLFSSDSTQQKRGFNVGSLRNDTVDGSAPGRIVSEDTNEVMRLKKRIWKSKDKASSYFAQKEIRAKKLKQIAAVRQKAAIDSKIVMYRKYRVGELPDIQIKHSELIVPLQAAAQCDSVIARDLFKMLFDAIMNELPKGFGEDTVTKLQGDIQDAINAMMNESIIFYPPFVYALEDACFRNEKLKLDANILAVASKASVQYPVGIVLLERQLLSDAPAELPSKKRRTAFAQNDDVQVWFELAKLYKSIDKYDFVHTIFRSQITRQVETRLALEAEERNDYAKALKLYNQMASRNDWHVDDLVQEEEEFWDIARLACCDNLAKWSHLKALTLQSIDDENPADIEKIWDDVYLQDQFLPYYIRSNLKLACHDSVDADAKQFGDFINKSLKMEDRKEVLESKFCDELAFARILEDNYGAAKHYVNLSIQRFCEEWSSLNNLMEGGKLKAVSRLQTLYEMKEFVDFVSKEENFSVAAVNGLLTTWSERQLDENLHSISVWDDLMINRWTYLKKIKLHLKDHYGSLYDEVEESLDLEQATYLLKIAETARKQGNYAVASKYLRESFNSAEKEKASQSGLTVKWHHVYAKVNCDEARKLPIAEGIPILCTVMEHLFGKDSNAAKEPCWNVQHHLHKTNTLSCIADIISEQDITDLSHLLGSEQLIVFKKISGQQPPMRKERFLDFINEKIFDHLRVAVDSSNQLIGDAPEKKSLVETSLMTMVKFCDKRLKENEDDSSGQGDSSGDSEYADIVVRYMLKAMTLDSMDARRRFPRLLQIIGRYPMTRSAFANEAAKVPTWMFLGWLNQIVAVLHQEEGDTAFPILASIAKEYPQALTYPLRTSSKQTHFANSPNEMKNKQKYGRLIELVRNPLNDEFIEALEELSRLSNVFGDWQKDMLSLLQVKRRDKKEIERCYGIIWKRLFQPVERNDRIKGELRKRCSKASSKLVQEYFGKNGSNIVDLPVTDFNNKYAKLLAELENIERKDFNLKDYSPWFSTFQGGQGERFIEIPGQYTGEQKPLPEYHARIAGFDERVRVMKSLRQPKQITMTGHNEKQYRFLVKGGEDLRLDQRIEQLFDIMNGILAKDSRCRAKALKLKTYQVIPLTTRIGMIEWMDKCSPLGDVLQDSYTEVERDALKKKRPAAEFKQFINAFKPSESSPKSLYMNLYKNASYTEVVTKFQQIEAMVPRDLLRRAFFKLASSTEAYFVLRNHFVLTHSCICICQYILGIGDRHPGNLMVNLSTGGMIGIDFGYSFGVSTTMLAVPELMPFRLTRQFLNLLLPLKDPGPYSIPMTDVLRALRNDSDLLLNTMDIFVQEPLLDWQVNAGKRKVKLDKEDETASWYPKEKISICKKKLRGINCAYITGEELRLGYQKCFAFAELLAVAHGNHKYNIRRKLLQQAEDYGGPERSFLQPEEQVACLIDQATDKNLLGRTFCGWESFL